MAMTGGIGYEIDQLTELGVPELMRRQGVDPQLKYALALQQATKMVEAAARERDMSQPMPAPANVVGQMETSLAKRLAPGVQMQGQRSQRMQNRAAMGLPGQAAPNLARMAQGGIVGYAEGGMPKVGAKSKGPIPQMSPEENAQMLKYLEGLKKFDYYDKNPDKVSPEGRQALEADRRAFEAQFPNSFRQKVSEMMYGPSKGMAMGGVVGYQEGGGVDVLKAALAAEGITDDDTVEFIRALYEQESSGGQDTRVSPAGARGPMQVMPATFTELMGEEADINDPVTNVRAGSRYARQMLDRAGGDPRLAAAGYYGGPGGMQAMREGRDVRAPQEGFPSVSEYADTVASRMPAQDEPIIDLGAGLEALKGGIASLFRPSRATAEARSIERSQMEQRGQEAAAQGERVRQALDVPSLTPEQIASVGAAADVEVVPEAVETLPERMPEIQRAETARREGLERAGLPSVAPEVTVPTRQEAFADMFPNAQSVAERFKVQKQLGTEEYPEGAPLKDAPKKGLAGLLSRIDMGKVANVVETLGRGAGASKGFEAAQIVQESAKARAIQQARQDQLDKLSQQLDVEREKIGATKSVAESRALAALNKEQREAVSKFIEQNRVQLMDIQEQIGAESMFDPRVLEAIRPELEAYLSAIGMAGSVGGLGTQSGISAEDQALIDQYSPST